METELIAMLMAYLSGEVKLDSLRFWVAVNIWDNSLESDILGEVISELAFIDDGHSDETHFHERVADILFPTVHVELGEREIITQTSSSDHRAEEIRITFDPGAVVDLRYAAVF